MPWRHVWILSKRNGNSKTYTIAHRSNNINSNLLSQSLDALLKTLLHVGSKSNNFYREDTEKALYLACNSVSPAKCLQGLMNGGLSHGSQLIRRQVAQFMCVTVEFHGAAKIVRLPRDVLDRVINATVILLGDADPLAR